MASALLRSALLGLPLLAGCLEGPGLEMRADLLVETDALTAEPPVLRPIARGSVPALAAVVRQLRVSEGVLQSPVAWAWARLSCELRSAAIEWSLARGPFALEAPVAPALTPLGSAEVGDEALAALAANRAFDAATVWVTGPLGARQAYVLPDGTTVTVPGGDVVAWPVHIGAVIDVEGSLEVLDLASGDASVPIDAWIAQFTPPGTTCPPVSVHEFGTIRAYWWRRIVQGTHPATPPPRTCGRVYSSSFRSGAPYLRDVPWLLPLDAGTLSGELTRAGAAVPEAEVPRVLSRFEPVGWPVPER